MHPQQRNPLSLPKRSIAIPLWILVVIGLILAAGGGAVAGSKITGKQIKNNSITGKDIKNKSLGLHDLRLKDVDKLADGTLPSGKTVSGGGILAQNAPSDSRYARSYAPLPFKTTVPLSNNPRNIFYGSTDIAAPGQSDTSRCSGSDTNPTAAPGTLCVYISGSTTNAGTESFVFPGANAGDDGADSNGFYLGINTPDAGGEVLIRYVWAYTAP